MRINLNKHLCIIGETQSGKTVLANELFRINDTKSLFIDIEDMGEIKAEREVNMNTSPTEFKAIIKHYSKIKYIPSTDPKTAQKEVLWIWNTLMSMNINICVFVDEIQNYGDSNRNVFDVYAIRGLKHGVHLVSISQRPAYVSKTIMTQTPVIVFFEIGTFEREYFRRYQLPYDRMLNIFYDIAENGDLTRKIPLYSFIVFERGQPIKGPFVLSGIR